MQRPNVLVPGDPVELIRGVTGIWAPRPGERGLGTVIGVYEDRWCCPWVIVLWMTIPAGFGRSHTAIRGVRPGSRISKLNYKAVRHISECKLIA